MDNSKAFEFNDNTDRIIILNNRVEMPLNGIGTGIVSLGGFKSILADVILRKGKEVIKAYKLKRVLEKATSLNCMMFDTSKAYGKSEKILGKAIKDNRRDAFIITKLTNSDQRKGNVREALLESMRALQVDYVDLFLMHWPQTETYLECWIQMEQLYKEGLVRAIGVSNFHQHHLEKLLEIATVVPVVNEIERHPLFNQKELINYCRSNAIDIIAYTPIGRMHDKIKENPILQSLSKKYDKSIAQIILRWHFQQKIISIPHTLKVERMKEYSEIFDFEISYEDMERINGINENMRLRYDPDNCDFSKL